MLLVLKTTQEWTLFQACGRCNNPDVSLLCCIIVLTIWSCDVEVGNIDYPHQEKPEIDKEVVKIYSLKDCGTSRRRAVDT